MEIFGLFVTIVGASTLAASVLRIVDLLEGKR
jgi:hypothetical protein